MLMAPFCFLREIRELSVQLTNSNHAAHLTLADRKRGKDGGRATHLTASNTPENGFKHEPFYCGAVEEEEKVILHLIKRKWYLIYSYLSSSLLYANFAFSNKCGLLCLWKGRGDVSQIVRRSSWQCTASSRRERGKLVFGKCTQFMILIKPLGEPKRSERLAI